MLNLYVHMYGMREVRDTGVSGDEWGAAGFGCVVLWLCAGRFYSLCFLVLSFPSRHCVPHQPPPSLRASRRLVRSFCSFVTPLFQKDSLNQKEILKIKWTRFEVKSLQNEDS